MEIRKSGLYHAINTIKYNIFSLSLKGVMKIYANAMKVRKGHMRWNRVFLILLLKVGNEIV